MLRTLVFVGIALQGLLFVGVPVFHMLTGELPGPIKDEPDPLKQWINAQIFKNSELTQEMLYSFWVLQWYCRKHVSSEGSYLASTVVVAIEFVKLAICLTAVAVTEGSVDGLRRALLKVRRLRLPPPL